MSIKNENKKEADPSAPNWPGFVIQINLQTGKSGEIPVFVRLYDDEKNGAMLSDDGGLVKAFLRQSDAIGVSFTESTLIEIVGTSAENVRNNSIAKHPDLVFLFMKDDAIMMRMVTNTDQARCLDSKEIVVFLSNDFPGDADADKIKEQVTEKVIGFAQFVLMIWENVVESNSN